jgi:hypothetical protein
MADRDRYEGYGSDQDRWRDREAGLRVEDERRSWSHEDYGRGSHHEGATYGQGAWRGAAQRPLQHEGQGRPHRDQPGREDFGHYGQTGAGGDFGYGHERYGGPESNRRFGRGGYGEGASRAPGDHAPSGPGGYGASADERGREGRGRRRAAGEGMTQASTHADFEPDYLHWRNTQMQKLDQEYLRWREERRVKFAKDFDAWRRAQGGGQEQHFPGSMQTAGQGSSGGVASEPAGGWEDKKKS